MSHTIVNLRDYIHALADFLIPIVSAWSAAGSKASGYGVDVYVAKATGEMNRTPGTGAGLAIYQPVASDPTDRVRNWGAPTGVVDADGNPMATDTDNGRIYQDGHAWANDPVSGQRWEAWSIDPKLALDILNNVTMKHVMLPGYGPLQRFTNADCQSATGWTVPAGGAVTVNTTETNVQTGASSLFFNPAGSDDYLKSPSIRVTPGQAYFISANYRVEGGPAYLVLWDETNDVEIENSRRVSHSLETFAVMQRMFTVPSTCEEVSVRIYITADTDEVYLDYVNGPWKPTDNVIDLPSNLTRASAVRKVTTARYAQPIPSINGGYDAYSRTFDTPLKIRRDYGVRIDHASANPYKLEITHNYRFPAQERWVEYIRPASDLTTWAFTAAGESSPTCSAPVEIVGSYWLRDLCELAVRPDPDDWETHRALDRLLGEKLPNGERKGGTLTALIADYERDLETPPVYQETTGFGLLRF